MAVQLCHRYITEYRKEVLVACIYGSVARQQDTPTSDIELVIVVKAGSRLREGKWLIDERAVGAYVVDLETLKAVVSTPSLRWPFQMGVLSSLEVVAGDKSTIDDLLNLGHNIPKANFHRALEDSLPQVIWESWGRVHSCNTRQDFSSLHLSAVEVLLEMRDVLCLLNQSYVTHDYLKGLQDSYEFQLLPEKWSDCVELIWWERDPKKVTTAVDLLVGNFKSLLSKEGLTIPSYSSIEQLPL